MVRPKMKYSSSVWCPYLRRDISIFERVRWATKLVTSIKDLGYQSSYIRKRFKIFR